MSSENQTAPEPEKADKADINSTKSNKKGLSAIIENVFRKFKNVGFIAFLLPLIFIYIFCLAVSFTPGIALFLWVSERVATEALFFKAFAYALSAGFGCIFFILTLIFIVPLMNLPLLPFVKPYRGAWFSVESIPWFYHNALTYLVRYTVLDFLTPSPLNILFFKMMGMKIGKGVMINTSNISDPCLIRLGDYVTLGGSAYVMAHYGMKGFLIIDRLVIKENAMIGLSAKILGGVSIGKKAVVGPNATVLPKTIIKDGEKFGIN